MVDSPPLLSDSTLRPEVLKDVVANNLSLLPPEFDDLTRFVISAVRAVARREPACALCAFVYSEAPVPEGQAHGFQRIWHMQDRHGEVEGKIILTGRSAHNGTCGGATASTIDAIMERISNIELQGRCLVIWDGGVRAATVYPNGIADAENVVRFDVPHADQELTQDDVCAVLNKAYDDNLKNPSGRTARLWAKGELVSNAEEEIERHLKGQIAMYFAGQSRPIQVLSQINTPAGRTDLFFVQQPTIGRPQLAGLLELKVLRGPLSSDRAVTKEGISQGANYQASLNLPFATLALYDVSENPSSETGQVLQDQDEALLAVVRVRRFAIFDSPQAWRTAGAPAAA